MTPKHSELFEGARRLPPHHITIRVPWHDHGWDGTVCCEPGSNTQCLALARIADGKRDEDEARIAGKRLAVLPAGGRPPCVDEHVTFMDSEGITLEKRHPYATIYPNTYGAFDETPLEIPPWSAAAVPFRWTLRSAVYDESGAGIASSLKLGYEPAREDELVKIVKEEDGCELMSQFIQHFENQRVMLDTFFSAVEPETSLCFFYANLTPLAEDRRRVIVAVGKVRRVGPPIEFRYKPGEPAIRGTLWERCVVHSIRPSDFQDGFVLPYAELLARVNDDPSIDLERLAAFAPDECFEQFSYGAELLPDDGAVAALVSVAASLHRIRDLLGARWEGAIGWVNDELNRLWKARGAFPGLGSALTAFGLVEHGTLLAYEIAAQQAREGVALDESPWARVDAIFRDTQRLPAELRRVIGKSFQKKWISLPPVRRALLELLSRFTLSAAQATRWYQPTARREAGITLSDSAILEDPYLLYEADRTRPDPIGFAVVDRGMWRPDEVRGAFPMPPPSALEDANDRRRGRALIIDALERGRAHAAPARLAHPSRAGRRPLAALPPRQGYARHGPRVPPVCARGLLTRR